MNQLLQTGFAIGIFLVVFLGKPAALQEFEIRGQAQGTGYSVKYFAKDSSIVKAEVDSVLMVIDSSMSLYKSYSAINRFNESTEGCVLDGHFAKVVKRSFEIYNDSRGLFDITVAPLVKYWGFGPKKGDQKLTALAEILPCVGMDQLELRGNFLSKKKACVQIDVNGIAQGYTVDVLSEFLHAKGISIFLVEVGGEIRVSGKKPDGKLMKIGIEGPSEQPWSEPIVQHVVSLDKGAITTSGNYRNYLMRGEKKISHLIDPKTGSPLEHTR